MRVLRPQDELFRCLFGTLGYFGIIVKATFKITDNIGLIEKAEEIQLGEFETYYKSRIQGNEIPLFGGRLNLDALGGDALRTVYMVRYEKDLACFGPLSTKDFHKEPKWGTRFQRIGLKLLSHLSNHAAQRLISWFWEGETKAMLKERRLTRNEALHPPINAFRILHQSHLHTQWLQEYFIQGRNLAAFLRFLGAELKANRVRLLNATIRPTPKDAVSILPYAEQDRYAVVICFSQMKDPQSIRKTEQWIQNVHKYLIEQGDVYYQAYMPFATREEFETAYGKETVAEMRRLKVKYDPDHVFGNQHTAKYYDE